MVTLLIRVRLLRGSIFLVAIAAQKGLAGNITAGKLLFDTIGVVVENVVLAQERLLCVCVSVCV